MPTFEEVAEVARRLRHEGQRISVRPVRRLLPHGGSPNVVAKHLNRWKAEQSYDPVVQTAGVPAAVHAASAGFLNAIWAAARTEVEKALEREYRKVEILRRECEKSVEVAWSEVDRLEIEVGDLRRRSASFTSASPVLSTEPPAVEASDGDGRFGARASVLRKRAIPARTRGDDPEMEALVASAETGWKRQILPPPAPRSARRYWEAVVRQAAELIAGSGRTWLSTDEILEGLRTTALGSDPRFEALTEPLLRRKLRERSEHGKHVRVDTADERMFGVRGSDEGPRVPRRRRRAA